MGAGASTMHAQKSFDSLQSKNRPTVTPGRMRPWATRSLVKSWRKRVFTEQLCAVVRHGERSDAVFSDFGSSWTDTQDFRDFPVDPPLSQQGLVQAREVGEYLARRGAESGEAFHIVVSSPYKRCVP